MTGRLLTAAAGAFLATATMAWAQSAPEAQTTPDAKCSPQQKKFIEMQIDALKGMKSSVGKTAKDFCAALDKTEEQAKTDDNGLIGDVLGLIKKHTGTDIDIKSISKMCKANEHVPEKAIEEQLEALEKARIGCQEPI